MTVQQSSTDHPGPAAEVVLQGVSKRYGKSVAVHPTSLTVRAGEFVTLLGPSGSGKTTILKMIAGFEDPTEGTISIAGRDVTHLAPHRRNVGFVFQQYALFPHLSVARNLAYPLEMRRMPRRDIDKAVGEALEMVRLSALGARRPSELSGGQQQRVALARAVIFRPPVLLMDESMAALDKRLRDEMQIEVRNLQRELKITTIAVTHDQTEALVMSDQVLVIDNGTLQQAGKPADLYYSPVSEFIAGFVGESNILQGRIDADQDGPVFVLPSGLRLSLGDAGGSQGATSACMLRPESIHVFPISAVVENGLRARVIERIFSGDVIRVRLQLSDGTELVSKVVSGKTRALPDVGDEAMVSWHRADLTVIPK